MKFNNKTKRIIAAALAFFLVFSMIVGLALFAFVLK